MLYTTTRTKTDSYTAYRTLTQDRAPDDGFFVPFRLPIFNSQEIAELKKRSFCENVAQLLDLFFSVKLTGWDIECCIGKIPAKIQTLSHRVLLAEFWHNTDGTYCHIANNLYHRLCPERSGASIPEWVHMAIRISLLFGIYGLISNADIKQLDIAVNTEGFSTPMAAWYARKMGLPIQMIICASKDNSTAWDLLHRGEMNTAMLSHSSAASVVEPVGIERLIYENFGVDEVQKYVNTCSKKGIYQIRPDMLQAISQGVFVSVVSNSRIESVIGSVYRSNQQLLDPQTAVCYGALQDYRAKIGESNQTLLLFESSPAIETEKVQQATGLSVSQIRQMCG